MSHVADPRQVPLRDSLVGQVLKGSANIVYHLAECIGEGGQGWVFRAHWDDPSGHVVIVKVLRPDVIATEALRRFQREADVLRMLSTQGRPNPYIVRFYDHAVAQVPSPYGSEPLALPFTVLEHVNGTTLEKVLAATRGRGLPTERVRRLLRQICQALDAVHSQKVVHRDLKPSNILLANEAGTEIAKVTDFGLVKVIDVNLQRTAALAGASLGYAPPEQYEQGNQRVSPRTDIFSLAAVAFEMLAGRAAFPFHQGENPLLIVTRILNGPRPTLASLRRSLAPELEAQPALVDALDRELSRALAADPGGRHESVMGLWSALEPALKAHTSAAPPGRSMPPPSGRPEEARPSAATPPPARRGPSPSAGRLRATLPMKPPSAWSWTRLTGPLGPGAVLGATFAPSGESAVAVLKQGLIRWSRAGWMPIGVPPLPAGAVRGVRWIRDGGVLIFGERGLAARVPPAGPPIVLRVPDPEITFLGALVEDNGMTLVGERPYRGAAARAVPATTAGVVAQFSGDRATVVSDAINCARLRAIARLGSGAIVACGDGGAIVRVELGVVEHIGSICAGHLLAIEPDAEGGAFTVGVGGHALSLNAELEPELEAVQTTRDLSALAVTEDGVAWAGSAQARLLRRSPIATSAPPIDHGRGRPRTHEWLRMSGELGITSTMLAVWASPTCVRAIGDDGGVVEGDAA